MKAILNIVGAMKETIKEHNAEIVCGILALNGNTNVLSVYRMLKK